MEQGAELDPRPSGGSGLGPFHPDCRKDTEKLGSTQRPLWPYWESQGSLEESPGGAVQANPGAFLNWEEVVASVVPSEGWNFPSGTQFSSLSSAGGGHWGQDSFIRAAGSVFPSPVG